MSLFILIWLVFVVVAKLIFNILFSTFLSVSKALALPVPERFFDNGREFTTCHLCRTGRKISLSLNTRNTKQKFIRWIEKEEHSKDRSIYLSGTTANLQAANIKITSKGTKWPLKKQRMNWNREWNDAKNLKTTNGKNSAVLFSTSVKIDRDNSATLNQRYWKMRKSTTKLNHFWLMLPFYSPWKHHKTFVFWYFQEV